MKRLAIIPTAFAFVVMVAACTDMTAPEVTPQFDHAVRAVGLCPPGTETVHDENPADRNGDGVVCLTKKVKGGPNIFRDNDVSIKAKKSGVLF